MNKHRVKGFSLIEVLIALLVLAVGLLGVLALQAASLQHNQSAYLESQAAFLANDILDRMRANKDNAPIYKTDLDSTVSATKDCASGACTPSQLVSWDLSQWKQLVADTLPAGRGAVDVTLDAVNGDNFAITVEYDIRDEGGTPRSFVLRTRI